MYEEDFEVDVEARTCRILSLEVEQPDPDTYTYDITDPAVPLPIPFPEHSFSPTDCPGGGVTYSISDHPWADIVGDTIVIEEDDTDNAGGPNTLTWTVCPAEESPAPC